MNISQLMNRTVETVRPDDSLALAAGKMWDHDVGCLPVVGPDGAVVGMITDRDICMGAYTQGRGLDTIPVSVAMSHEVFACRASDGIIEAEETMRSRQVRRLPVVDDMGMLVGIVSLNDIAREAGREAGRKAREVSAQEVTATLAAVCVPRRPGSLEVAAA